MDMDCYFVSDDRYFLSGIQKMSAARKIKIQVIHSSELTADFHPYPGDVVSVYLSDIKARYKIVHSPIIAMCRVILILKVDAPLGYICSGCFPWLLPKVTSVDDLFLCVSRARAAAFEKRSSSELEELVFHYLCEGYKISHISRMTGVSEKYLYALALKVTKQYGLRKCSPTSVMLCRDILRLSRSDNLSFPKLKRDSKRN